VNTGRSLSIHVIAYLIPILFLCTAPSFGASNASEILEKLYEQTFIINNYQADIIVMKHDPGFLYKLFPEGKEVAGDFPCKGKVSFYRPCCFNLMFELSTERKLELISNDGMRLYLRAPFTVTCPKKCFPSPYVSVVDFVPGETLTYAPFFAPTTADTVTFNGDMTAVMHAVNIVFPYILRNRVPEDLLEPVGSEKVSGEDCHVLKLSTAAYGEITLWIHKKDSYVMREQYYDSDTGRKIDGYFEKFAVYTKDGKNYHFFKAVEVTMDDRLIYSASLSRFEFNIDSVKVFGYIAPSKMWNFSGKIHICNCASNVHADSEHTGDEGESFTQKLPFFRDLFPLCQDPIFFSLILSYVIIFILLVLGRLVHRYTRSVMTQELFRSR